MSRASLVHGTNHTMNDTWYDVDSFLLDQAKEVLNKLVDGSIDDEIWGKIVVMERCKRVAKAYLRKTTVIVDGSEDEFDGKTLGFNHFDNNDRDEHTNEIRSKIGDGVILKMDLQGNIKGMARGTIPVITQGWRGERNNCISDRLIRQQGRLNAGEEEKAYKMFDMKKFKYCLERELHDGIPDPKQLLLKTCVRVALVKDGNDMARTPCWFAIVNLVALDMLREKIPNIRKLVKADVLSTSVPSTQSSNSAISQEALTHIIAAAVNQVNNGRTVNPAEIAQLASSLNFSTNLNETISKSIRSNDIPKRKHYHCSSSSLDSSGEDTTKTGRRWENNQKLYESFYDSGIEKTREKEKKKTGRNAPTSRPRLSDVVFTRSHSITSDYDSNREVFDSGSWSSTNSRGFKTQSTASSLVSETELGSTVNEHGRAHLADVVDTRNIHIDKYGKSIDDESDLSLHSVVSNTNDSSAPSHHRSTTEIHIGSSEDSEQKTDEDEGEEMNESAEESCDTRSNSSGQVERLREASSRKSAIEEGTEQSMIDAHHQQMPNQFTRNAARRWKPKFITNQDANTDFHGIPQCVGHQPETMERTPQQVPESPSSTNSDRSFINGPDPQFDEEHRSGQFRKREDELRNQSLPKWASTAVQRWGTESFQSNIPQHRTTQQYQPAVNCWPEAVPNASTTHRIPTTGMGRTYMEASAIMDRFQPEGSDEPAQVLHTTQASNNSSSHHISIHNKPIDTDIQHKPFIRATTPTNLLCPAVREPTSVAWHSPPQPESDNQWPEQSDAAMEPSQQIHQQHQLTALRELPHFHGPDHIIPPNNQQCTSLTNIRGETYNSADGRLNLDELFDDLPSLSV
ncbi:unnamed protein product [Auanema sp. JU1783]|nr:unnamed protein product [Auanema sp. JU1783]